MTDRHRAIPVLPLASMRIDFVVTLTLQNSLWDQVNLASYWVLLIEHSLNATVTQEPLSNARLLGTQPKMS